MSKVIAIMGESGSGKTTAMRNLPPAETYYIDCDKKGLSWKGWRQGFSADNKNYIATNDAERVRKYLHTINDKATHIKYVVIDTLNGIMVGDEMRRAKEKGYDKWVDLCQCIWDMVDEAYSFREDLTIIFLCHSQTERDESGFEFTRIMTSGKKLNKIVLESKFTSVLLSRCIDGRYVFETHSNNSTVKTPMGAFDEDIIDNDIMNVISALKDY